MKYGFLLFTFLLGLSFAEIACGPCTDSGPYDVAINGVTTQWIYSSTRFPIEDSVSVKDSFQSSQIGIMAKVAFVAVSNNYEYHWSNLAYADDCDFPYPVYQNQIVNVRVTDKSTEEDITNDFLYFQEYSLDSIELNSEDFIREMNYGQDYFDDGYFILKNIPLEPIRQEYIFKIEVDDGNKFETTTNPIIITP